VEITIERDHSRETLLARLGPGQFFGEVELANGGHSIARVRGALNGAELACLPKATFFELIDGSPLTRHAIHEIAATRLAENKIRRKIGQ
jgi:CRP-like cAMP-binding protein